MSIASPSTPDSPIFSWFDAHSHLQDPRLAAHLQGVFDRAFAAGVDCVHVAATSEADWPAVASLADAHPGRILCSFGIHPWFILNRGGQWLRDLRSLLASRPAGIGEIGLDGRMEDGLDADRETVFRAQLELSFELALPASLHCRDAWGKMLEILLALPPHPAGILVHAYSGPPDALPALAANNVHVSFGGTLTRPNNVRARENAASVPLDRFLLESDAPDLPPSPADGMKPHLIDENGKILSEPAYVPLVGRRLAEIRGIPVSDVAAQTTATAKRLFAKLF